jgi:hypothetical protein
MLRDMGDDTAITLARLAVLPSQIIELELPTAPRKAADPARFSSRVTL